MFFKFSTKKAIEASAMLLRLAGHKTMVRKRLLALLYLADRRALAETGRPILGGHLYALKWGPIHSEVYDLIKGGHRDQIAWSNHFENESYNVILASDPGVSELSRYDVNLLNKISEECVGMDDFDVAYLTHFSEWERVYKQDTSTLIPPEVYIDAVGLGSKKDDILGKPPNSSAPRREVARRATPETSEDRRPLGPPRPESIFWSPSHD